MDPNAPPPPGSSTPRKLIDFSLIVVASLALAAGIGVAYQSGLGRVWEIFLDETLLTAELLPKIVAGVLAASALPMLIAPERIKSWIGPDSGLRGLTIATIAGMLVPGGPGVTFPLTMGLLAAGADMGAGVALVSGWMLLGLNRTLIWELTFLPADFVALRFVLSLPAPIVLGWVVRHTLRRSEARQ